MSHEVLRIENLIMEINGIRTLNDFHISLYKGEIKGIYISQGNVKKALSDMFMGLQEPLRGTFYLEDVQFEPSEISSYVHVIESTSKLVERMSIANNIFVIRDGIREQFLEDKVLNIQAENLFKKLKINLSVDKKVHTLTSYEKVLIEIAKAVGLGRKVIVFKDLSSFLSDAELEQLNTIVGELNQFTCQFLFVDSFLEVLQRMTDNIVWIKNGRNKWQFSDLVPKGLDKDDLTIETNLDQVGTKKPVLSFNHFIFESSNPLNLSVYPGEIINILDREGRALERIIQVIQGDGVENTIYLEDQVLSIKNTDDAVKKGIGFISDNPTKTMLIPGLTALENLCYIVERKIKWFWMKRDYKLSLLEHYENRFDALNHEVYIDQLSIVDRQKLVYYKWHAYKPKVLFIYRPFTSIDQELRQLTSDLIKELAASGIAIVLLSNNISELKLSVKGYEIKSKK